MAEMQKRITRPTMKRKKARSKISLKRVYFTIIGVVFLVSLLVSWLGSSKEDATINSSGFSRGRPEWYKRTALNAIGEIRRHIDATKPSGDELQQLEDKVRNLGKIGRYETYLPFSAPYSTAPKQMAGNPELVQIHDELVNFAMPVWEELSKTIDEPTDTNIRELSLYMASLKPEVLRLIKMVEEGSDILDQPLQSTAFKNETIRSQTLSCLDGLAKTIDREK